MTRNTKADSISPFEAENGKKATVSRNSPKTTETNFSPEHGKETSSSSKKTDMKPDAKATPKASEATATTLAPGVEKTSAVREKEEKKPEAQSVSPSPKAPSSKGSSQETPSQQATPGVSSPTLPEVTESKPFSSNIEQKPSATKKPDARSMAPAEPQRQPSQTGIDAMSLLKSSENTKGSGRTRGFGASKSGAHRSAAEVIAKTTSRDHPKPSIVHQSNVAKKQPSQSAGTSKSVKPEVKAQSRLTPKVPIPPEPKGPIGGVPLQRPSVPLIKEAAIATVLNADHPDPFSFFGMHKSGAANTLIVRVFYPEANAIQLIDNAGKVIADLQKAHDEGLFATEISDHTEPFPYRLRVTTLSGKTDIDDPYRFPPTLSEKDAQDLANGRSFTLYKLLGAHTARIDGVTGVAFAVWAPNASHVAVVGDFNAWDGRRHSMRFHPNCGVWEMFLPGVGSGSLYKYEIKHTPGSVPEIKSDPCAFYTELPLGTASVVYDDGTAFPWQDSDWIKNRKTRTGADKPLSFYEVHLGSWRRKPEEDNRWLDYREMADDLVTYCVDMGFTHISLLPVSEYIYDDTVGYLPSSLYAPTNRYGTPDDLRYFINVCHKAGIGVVADWVPNYFSEEEHGLASFDGAPLYEHKNPWQGRDPDWNVPLYDLARKEVVNYLISNALYWFDHFHLDGLRIDGLAKMLYLDYGRAEGEWTPNADGGNENLDALAFIRQLNQLVAREYPGALMIAEDSSLRGNLTKPVSEGGLGFTLRWNTAWVYDTLRYLGRHPVHRKYYQFELTNPLAYAFDERFVLPVSHNHVSIGQGAMSNKFPGDYWQRFATLRAWYALLYALPNKKLLFMGTEFAQDREWNSNISLDWHLLDNHMHRGIQDLIRDLNKLYLKNSALHDSDTDAEGFQWIDTADDDSSIISFLRFTKDHAKFVVVVTHVTPVVRPNYRIGVPKAGRYREILNTDAEVYGGGNQGSAGSATAEQHWAHGREFSICLTLPPYATVILEPEEEK
uniref:1,4-alpha-glucan branching enzyme GlgB n=1 Tax=Candidatus Kentrum sp. MB TaxID=2138164 RepID=A0A450XH17_9GAMM|nr:MAG: 1,4-alpha-glucan branching enzyme [Candidatus Kentron sp. MB]